MTVRQAIVMFACRDMARAMWRVTTGSTTFADCKRPSFDGRRNRVGSEQCGDEMMRMMLYEAAQIVLIRATKWSWQDRALGSLATRRVTQGDWAGVW